MVGKGQEALLCVEDVAQMLTDAHILEAALLSNWLTPLLLDEVSPLGETALARQFGFSATCDWKPHDWGRR